jgi:nucleotide-binding universal stress UspA family protein
MARARSLLKVIPGKGGAMKKLVIATDGSAPAKEAVDFGLEIAAEQGADVTFVHAMPVDEYFVAGRSGGTVPLVHPVPINDSDTALNEAAEAAKGAGIAYTLEKLAAPTVDGILSVADKQDADLIVVGSRGRGAVGAALLGSVSRDLVRRAKRPVLVVKTAPVLVEA